MNFKFIQHLFILIICAIGHGQNSKFGDISTKATEMTAYQGDTDASAVVLFESGNDYFTEIRSKLYVVKSYHARIKILAKKGFEHSTISIPLYNEEDFINFKAVTYNQGNQSEVNVKDVFTTKENDYVSTRKFTFPNVQIGSILEYQYDIVSPYFARLEGWDFQSELPKLYSEYRTKIPGLFKYNRALVGTLPLSVNEAEIEKHCLRSAYFKAECESLKYAMYDVPALQYQDGHSLSPKNYSSRIKFELAKITFSNSSKANQPKTWKELDRAFRENESIGSQLQKKGFFRRQAPKELFVGTSQLEKSKKIFTFIRNHFTWNGSNGFYSYKNVKQAFKEQKGNAAEINMALITLLNEAGIHTELMLLSTRDKGLPRRSYASLQDFNYYIGITRVNGRTYMLDATDKAIPFGVLPYRALNHYGRVMSYDGPSFWQEIEPYAKNKKQVRTRIILDTKTNELSGAINILNLGYDATDVRNSESFYNEESRMNTVAEKTQSNVTLMSYQKDVSRTSELKVPEQFEFQGQFNSVNNRIYLNPFIIKILDENPFKLKQRDYPIDFGYPRKYESQVSIQIPEGYEIDELPEDMGLELGQNLAKLKCTSIHDEKTALISFSLSINNSYFSEKDYSVLKQLFTQAIDIQANSLIVFKKK